MPSYRNSPQFAEELVVHVKKWFLAAFWLIAVLLLFGTSYFTVPADSVAVVQRFGKYIGTDEPGLHFKIPFGIDRVTSVAVRRQLKLEFGFSSPQASNPYQGSREPQQEQDMVTGDLNSAQVEWVVQYRIDDPKQYLFATSDPEDTLRSAAEAVMREVVGDRTIDEVITFGRQEIETAFLPLIQEIVKRYQLGLRVDLIQLKNINPPAPVQASFNDVNNAQQEKQRSMNLATGEYNRVIPKARGEANKVISEAEGYAAKRINEANGDATYFNDMFAQFSKAPDVTRKRLYLETMGEILPKMGHKLIIDKDSSWLMPFVLPTQMPAIGTSK
jgi:membrane protease subunit HflK